MTKITSQTEKRILKVLIETRQEMTVYQITKLVYNNPDTITVMSRSECIRKRIKNLEDRGIVKKKNSYPVFYRINEDLARDIRQEVIKREIKCPCCKTLHWVEDFQQTKQCNCLKPNGKHRRFWITPDRFTGRKKLI